MADKPKKEMNYTEARRSKKGAMRVQQAVRNVGRKASDKLVDDKPDSKLKRAGLKAVSKGAKKVADFIYEKGALPAAGAQGRAEYKLDKMIEKGARGGKGKIGRKKI